MAHIWIDQALGGDDLHMTPKIRIANPDGSWATSQVELGELYVVDGFDGYDWDIMDVDLLPGGNLVISYLSSTAEVGEDEPVFSIIDPSALDTPAQYVLINKEVQSNDTTVFESPPGTTVLENGNILFAWTNNATLDDTPIMDLQGRIFDPSTKSWESNEFLINTDTVDGFDGYDIENFSAEMLDNGKVVVGYVENSLSGGTDNSP